MPFTWLDLEADPQVSQLLKRFGVTEADTPVVAWGHERAPAQSLESRAWRKLSAFAGRWNRRCTTWSWSGPGRRVWQRRSTAPPRG